jgi:hypothetical protein
VVDSQVVNVTCRAYLNLENIALRLKLESFKIVPRRRPAEMIEEVKKNEGVHIEEADIFGFRMSD